MSRVGRFLIARPTVNLGFFSKSIVYIYEDSANGTAGIALSSPSALTLRDLVLQKRGQYSGSDRPIYRGGPVSVSAIMMLHSDDFVSTNTLHTGAGFDVSSDDLMIEKLVSGAEPTYFRLVAGGSVWAPGQLDTEIAKGCWLVSDLDPEIVFGLEREEQWTAAIESAGSQIIARYF